jgi:trk system potassium uptake protein TrkH
VSTRTPLYRARQTDRAAGGKIESVTLHLVGVVLFAAGCGMLACGAVELLDGGTKSAALFGPGIGFAVGGGLLFRRTISPVRIPSATIYGAILTAWAAFAIAAALPYMLSGVLDRFDLALFEAVSGFTTTASTVLRSPEAVSHGILLWRATTQWFGGVAITVFVVSVLPYVRSAGFEHLAGISHSWGAERMASRIQEMAKRIVLVYSGFTLVVAALYALFGMGTFDAIAHAFSTVSTGGFSTHRESLAFFNSAGIEWTAIGAMILAGGNFALYWQALRGRPLKLFRSVELRAYLIIVTLVAVAAVGWMTTSGAAADDVRRSIFGAVSIATTTGWRVVDYTQWAGAVQLVLLFAMVVGGMPGGAAGGFKTFRLLAVVGHTRRHLFRQLHPRAVPLVRISGEVISDTVISGILGFFALFMGVGAVATLMVSAIGGHDLPTSISLVASSLGNVGPALGTFTHHADLHAGVRDVLMVVMLAGRLEIYPVVLGLVPVFRFIGNLLPPKVALAVARLGRG